MVDGTSKIVGITELQLDEENPRLPEDQGRSQREMLNYIAETTAIEELMGAIAENDFFPGEPLIAIRNPKKADSYIVVEGNRRLAALKLLQNPDETSRPSNKIREISKNAKHKPTDVPIVVCPDRVGVLPYLGFRHITGVKQWEPLAKARYIEQLYATRTADEPKMRYGEIAKIIGSRRDHIKRNLDALAVYKVIKDADFYNIDGLDEESLKFAVLSTALADERIGGFVGLTDVSDEQNPIDHPGVLKPEPIQELTKWLYEKDNKGKTKVGESRNLRLLAAVISNERALTSFKSGSPLKIAYQLTSDVKQDFLELLYQADGVLSEAASMVATVDYDEDAIQVARRITSTIRLIGRALEQKNEADDGGF